MRIEVLVLALAIAGCSPPPDPRRTNFEIRGKEAIAKYDPKSGKLKKLDVDTDKNGRMESFSYWDGPRLLLIEVDKNEDGRIERWEHYDEHNKLVKVGGASGSGGVEDMWDFPDAAGLLAKVEHDENHDGVVDKRYLYASPPGRPDLRVIVVAELNIDANGQPGQRVHYRFDGTHERTEDLRKP